MAVAISTPSVQTRTSPQMLAAGWASMSAAVALLTTVPLAWILADPISGLVFVRGSQHEGNWAYVILITVVIMAPATYALFLGTAGELLKPRMSTGAHRTMVRIGAMGMVPYCLMTIAAAYWTGGPQRALMILAALTIPIAMALTIWASTQTEEFSFPGQAGSV